MCFFFHLHPTLISNQPNIPAPPPQAEISHHPAVQVLDDLLTKVHDPEERAKLLRLKRDHSDKIEAAIRGVAQRENLHRRASAEAELEKDE